jgi:hypothetical protein
MAMHDEPKLIFPALAGFYRRFSPFSYAFMRFATGAILLPHGVQKILNVPISKFAPNIAAKGLPFAEGLAYLTYFAESVAAVCLAIGLFTRIAAHDRNRDADHRSAFPMAVRILLDGPRLRVRLALAAPLHCHLLQGRWPLFDRSNDRQGVLTSMVVAYVRERSG